MLQEKDYIIRGRKGYKTVVEMVENSCKQYSDKVIMQKKFDEKHYTKFTYAEFWDDVVNISKGLRLMFLLPKERVGIYSENRPEWGEAYVAISRAGGIIVPLDAQLGPAELEYILNHSSSKFVFTSKKYLPNLLEVFKSVKSLKRIICFDCVTKDKNVVLLKDMIAKGKKRKKVILPKVKPNDVLEILYTSGTTGVSKGVMLTNTNIVHDFEASSQILPVGPTDVMLSILPIHHSFECTAGFLLPIYNGSTITYAESLRSTNILANIKETGVTLMLGVPLLYEKLYAGILKAVKEKPFFVKMLFYSSKGVVKAVRKLSNKKIGKKVFAGLREKAGLNTIRFFVSGGGPLHPLVAEGFDDLGITILQGYGLTETSPVVSVSTLQYMDYYSVGLPIPGVEVKIDNPDENGNGEILVKGPIVMKGYYKNKKATKEVIKNGWLYTGDIGYRDKKIGFIYITGRKKNLIVTTGGKNVFPEELEKKLNASPFILESMVYGIPVSEKNRGENVAALIVPDYEVIYEHGRQTGQKFDTEDKIEALIYKEVKKVNSRIPDYKKIRDFKIHPEELQKTSTRKIKRYLYLEKLIHVNGKRKK